MPIPDYQWLMLPVLGLAADRNEHSLAQMRECIATQLKLSDDELAERLASDSQTVFANRIGWAVQYLKAAAALEPVRRGVYQITDRGLSLLKEKPSEITVRLLRQFPEFMEFEGKGPTPGSAATAAPIIETKATPEESLEHKQGRSDDNAYHQSQRHCGALNRNEIGGSPEVYLDAKGLRGYCQRNDRLCW